MEQAPGTGPIKLEGNEKLAVEFGPIAVLLLGYVLNGTLGPMLDSAFGTELFAGDEGRLYTGLALFMPAFIAAFGYSVYRTERIVPLLAVTGVLVIGLGIMTFVFQDKRFFYVKPTIVYGLTSGALAAGLLTGRNFLRILFDGAIEMSGEAWRTFTWRFIAFNAAMALANEALWRTLVPIGQEGWWLTIKGIGFTIAYFAFIAANAPFLMKHANLDEKKD
ncbi:inner membrane-spanning protein YciB [Parvularcula lutaonensis]|uniref:Inner membrane-spanning protein YciB n=1 Tax=Parvularcula lutaonensis TaxID=491923 RepID=A0ABV7MBG0_9PROT|nr:septation protein IspZ [Parvularcula lutaonensis]GGY47445.1 putative intracellular septation protein A [Parvularcula lutaonensis]